MKRPVVAYFSAEYAIADDLPIFAGGLGILAADIVLESGNSNQEFYALGLVYHEAFTGDDPDQRQMTERLTANGFEPATDPHGERIVVRVLVEKRTVALQGWVKKWGQTRLILLDARMDENAEQDQAISDHLYPQELTIELAQQMCLGFGGVAMLSEMGVRPDVYHLNEGHTAMAGLAVVLNHLKDHSDLNFEQAIAAVRQTIVGTKHTVLRGAGLTLDWPTVAIKVEPTLVAHGATIDDLKGVATPAKGSYSDTKLLVSLAHRMSGVSKMHIAREKVPAPG